VLKIENEVEEIPQSIGVCQGDNMAPVLFLFLMTAFAETLKLVWKQMDIPMLSVMTTADKNLANRKICSHTPAMFELKSSPHMRYYSAFTLMTAPSHLARERICDKEWN
jgi:hypothetical protein